MPGKAEAGPVRYEEVKRLIRLGILDPSHEADRQAALSLLDGEGKTPMSWDGIPEHRNLGRDGDVPDLSPGESAARFLDAVQRQNRLHAEAAQRRQAFLNDIAARRAEAAGRQASGDMPPDPFSGGAVGAVAQGEMFRSLVEGGMTEPQALYYLACLVQVGLAMQLGKFNGELPPWPGEPG